MQKYTLLMDFNNLALRCLFAGHCIEKETKTVDYQIWSFTVFKSIYASLYTFKDAKEVVLAVDDKSWRKIVYPVYKANRAKDESEWPVNWVEFYAYMEEFLEKIKNNLPWKVVKVKSAEADDVIGVLARKVKKEFIIVSADKDYKQLITSNVKMYDPLKKEYVKCSDTERFILEACLHGQKKDNILNVLTPLDWDSEKRVPPMGDKKVSKILDEIGLENWLNEDPKRRERFKQNQQVMDLSHTPQVIVDRTLELYHNYCLPDPSNIIPFIMESGWRGIIDDVHKVESKLLNLY